MHRPRRQRCSARAAYDPRLALKKELELFMDSILRSDRPVTDLLTADYTFINEQVALIYGYTDIRGNGFHKVTLEYPNRHGLLGKGAVLMLTANPNRTAPVLRGAWIMERIRYPGDPHPRAQPADAVKGKAATVASRPIHRRNPAASCRSDGSAGRAENFDTVGAYAPSTRSRAGPSIPRAPCPTARSWPDRRTCTRRWPRAATSSRRSSPRS
jgi:hypothetical protein